MYITEEEFNKFSKPIEFEIVNKDYIVDGKVISNVPHIVTMLYGELVTTETLAKIEKLLIVMQESNLNELEYID